MPLYIRKKDSWTPNSLREESFILDDDDFVQDPDQQRDLLPQPYRMIDKIVCNVIDNVWEQVDERESERIADASKFRPPQYECAVHVESDTTSPLSRSESMCTTPDGQFVILGLLEGLAVINAESQQTVDIWPDENLHVTHLHTVALSDGTYLISTIDDMGVARLFALAGSQIYQLSSINEGSADNKIIVGLCEASSNGDYLAVSMQKPSSQVGWVEVHKLPKDAWIKDLDSLVAKSAPKENVLEEAAEKQQTMETVDVTGQTTEGTDEQRSQSPGSQRGGRSSHKFAPTSIHCKVLPPPGQITGSGISSLQQACKSVDGSCDVIGSGMHHMITTAHLQQRHTVFSEQNESLMKYLPKEDSSPLSIPTCHFLQPGRILPQGMDSCAPTGPTNSLAIWWSHSNQLLLYSLVKQAKDLERKPDAVFPLSSCIVASCASCDGTKVALALDNNNLVVWDMYLGCPKGVKHITDEGKVSCLTLLDPSICTQDNTEYPPYPLTTSYYVMVTMDDGRLYLFNCGHMREPPVQVDLAVTKEQEIPTICCPIKGLPNLILTSRRNGRIFLHDIHHGNQLCEIVLPVEYELATPWQPLISTAANGRMLYLKGQMKTPPQSSPTDEDDSAGRQVAPPEAFLFVFQLRSFPALDRYRDSDIPTVPYVVHSTVNDRVNALLRERISQQSSRVSRMQTRWSNFTQQIDDIKRMQENVKTKAQKNSFPHAGRRTELCG